MKIITFLFILASICLGFVAGAAFVTIFNFSTIKELQEENNKLRREVNEIKRRKANTIEIIDNRAEPESYFTPF